MDIEQLIVYVIVPALYKLANTASEQTKLIRPNAVQLMVATGALESLFKWIKQINGIACSLWQIEPATDKDIYDNYLNYHAAMQQNLDEIKIKSLSSEYNLMTNLMYGACMCRLQYYRRKEPLPDLVTDKDEDKQKKKKAMFDYYKKYFNSYKGATKYEAFKNAFDMFNLDAIDYNKLIKKGIKKYEDNLL